MGAILNSGDDMLANKFFVSGNGDLFDTTRNDWHKGEPLRTGYKLHNSDIVKPADIVASLRAGEWAFPGGYRLAFVCHDGGVLSYKAVKDNLYSVVHSTRHNYRDGWHVVGLICVDECEGAIYCDHTGELLNGVNDYE